MNIKALFVQQAIEDGICKIARAPTDENPADTMAKAVDVETFDEAIARRRTA